MRYQSAGKSGNGLVLQPHAPRSRKRSECQALASQKDIFEAHELDVVVHAWFKRGDVPRVHLDRLPGLQLDLA